MAYFQMYQKRKPLTIFRLSHLNEMMFFCYCIASEPTLDSTSIVEYGKIKKRIVDMYRSKAKKLFAEKFADFNKDNWLNVYCSDSGGLKLYRGEMFCPLCYKKLTPQNRAMAGYLPSWDLNGVKGHVVKFHSEEKIVEKGSSIDKDRFVKEGKFLDKDSPDEQDQSNVQNPHVENELPVEENPSVKQDPPVEKNADEIGVKPLQHFKSYEKYPDIESPEESTPTDSLSSRSRSSSSSSERQESDETTVSTKHGSKRRRHYQRKSIERGAWNKREKSRKTREPKTKRARRPSKCGSQEIPDWKKPGVEFGWVRFTASSRFLPAFIFPLENNNKKRKAQQILSKVNCNNPIDLLADKKHEIDAIATPFQEEQTKKNAKSRPYLAALKQFNLLNGTEFA